MSRTTLFSPTTVSCGLLVTVTMLGYLVAQEDSNKPIPDQPTTPRRSGAFSPNQPPSPSGFARDEYGQTRAYPTSPVPGFPGNPLSNNSIQAFDDPRTNLSEQEMAKARAFQSLVLQFRTNKDAQQTEVLRDKLREIIEMQLEQDLEDRETRLREIEDRAKQLRSQLDTRRESKEETVKLLMMLVENPTAGFGLPNQWLQSLVSPIQPNPYRSSRPAQSSRFPHNNSFPPASNPETFRSNTAPPRPRNGGAPDPFGASSPNDPFDRASDNPFGSSANARRPSQNPFADGPPPSRSSQNNGSESQDDPFGGNTSGGNPFGTY